MLKMLREQTKITQKDLGDQLGVTRQTIAAWENGERTPSVEQAARLAKIFGVPLGNFIETSETLEHTLLFRADKPSVLSPGFRKFLSTKAEDYASVEKLAGAIPVVPPSRPTEGYASRNVEFLAREVRDWLGVEDAPLGDVLALLEWKGLKVILHNLPEEVSGLSAYTDELGGIIFVNSNHPTERQYFTALHELIHLMFHRMDYKKPVTDKKTTTNREKLANHLAGAIMLPGILVEAELNNYRNRWIPEPLLLDIKYRYSVSMAAILYRAEQVGIISRKQMGQQMGILNGKYGKTKEPGDVPRPNPLGRLERLVYQNLLNEKITASRAAEIIGKRLSEVRAELDRWLDQGVCA